MGTSVALCMIVKNEEKNLPTLLASVMGCFQELHIVDTGSTDKTLSVLNHWTLEPIHIHHFEWIHDYSAARNFSFSKATTDYVMWMDGDDRLETPEKFRAWRDSRMDKRDIWFAPYVYLDEKGLVLGKYFRERVVKRLLDLKWHYPIHEAIDTRTIKGYSTLDWEIRQVPRADRDPLKTLNDFQRLLKTGYELDARMEWYFGRELFRAQDHEAAHFWLGKALAPHKGKSLLPGETLACASTLARSLLMTEQFEEALAILDAGIADAPEWAEFHYLAGLVRFTQKQYWEAVPHFRKAVSCPAPEMGLSFQGSIDVRKVALDCIDECERLERQTLSQTTKEAK